MKNKKIINSASLKQFLRKIRDNKKKSIVLCHGVFDILHVGHIKYLEAAKKKGDVLIVSLTTDKYVNKGFGRPYFNEQLRAKMLASLEVVDAVIFSNSYNAVKVINLVKPDIYAKGFEYKKIKNDITKNISLEIKEVKKNNGKIVYVNEVVFSSSRIINTYGEVFNKKQFLYIENLKKKYGSSRILDYFNKTLNQKILVIGESILDKYIYCNPLGKSGKEPYLAFLEERNEIYLGGALAVCRQLSEFSKNISIISYLGDNKNYEKIINKNLPKNIKKYFLFKKNSPTILKTRYVDIVSGRKIFGSYLMNDNYLSKEKDLEFLSKIRKISEKVDHILIADYGHGLINKDAAKTISSLKKSISINTQINASNIGYHNIRNYKNSQNIIINESELRYEFRDRISSLSELGKRLVKEMKAKNLVITKGANGSVLINNKKEIFECPAFTQNIVDKVGAGDTMLSLLAVCLDLNIPEDISIFFGNLIGSMSVKIIANKEPVKFLDLYRTIEFAIK